MSKGGQNVKSTKEHKEKGNHRPSRHGGRIETVAKPLEKQPEPPADFDKKHRDKWAEVCKRVFDLGILTDCDLDLIGLYVRTWFINIDAWKQIQKDGVTIETARGLTKHPSLNTLRESSTTLVSIASLFGFSPQARMRIRTEEKKDVDPFAAFLNN